MNIEFMTPEEICNRWTPDPDNRDAVVLHNWFCLYRDMLLQLREILDVEDDEL